MKINNHLFYKHSYLKHNNSAKGLHWTSKETQEKRFEILLDFLNGKINPHFIIDIGCGYGHLIEYFQKIKNYPKSYLGIDCEEFMIEICKKDFKNYRFRTLNILVDDIPNNDYCLCSGTLNLFDKEEIFLAIKKMYQSSKKGIIFNHITNNFNKVSKEEVLDFCKKLTNKIELKENYLENDYTIFMNK